LLHVPPWLTLVHVPTVPYVIAVPLQSAGTHPVLWLKFGELHVIGPALCWYPPLQLTWHVPPSGTLLQLPTPPLATLLMSHVARANEGEQKRTEQHQHQERMRTTTASVAVLETRVEEKQSKMPRRWKEQYGGRSVSFSIGPGTHDSAMSLPT
jgi:hypothetical protein